MTELLREDFEDNNGCLVSFSELSSSCPAEEVEILCLKHNGLFMAGGMDVIRAFVVVFFFSTFYSISSFHISIQSKHFQGISIPKLTFWPDFPLKAG